MRTLLLLFSACAMYPAVTLAQGLDLSGYQEPDGAITAGYHGDTVDPYFATRALLIARDGGLKMRAPAMAWVKWMIRMQRPDGRFDRYSRDAAGDWHSYASADADDATLALWLELLYRLAPDSGLPETWQRSARKAENQLQGLYDPKQGIYHISADMPVELLMDNIEIYSAFRNIAHAQKRMGLPDKAAMYEHKAARLNANILQVFKQEDSDALLVSTQIIGEDAFYPDRVAQIFPLLYQLRDGRDPENTYHDWIDANGKEWLKQGKEDYPWGVIAIIALNMNDVGSASCWQNTAEPMRYSRHWNVLEESALQQVKWRLSVLHYMAIPCVGENLL